MKSSHPRLLRVAITGIIFLASTCGHAFQVLPKVSDVDRKLSRYGANPFIDSVGHLVLGNALPLLKSPVHEAITLAAFGCSSPSGDERACVTHEAVTAQRIVLYGVRWPDDPPFRLSTSKPPRIRNCDVNVTMRSTAQPKCWLGLFKDAGSQSMLAFEKSPGTPAFGPGDYLLYRSHFGDLQFFHSMGTHDGETAAVTAARMKMWTRFLWGIAIRETPVDRFMRDIAPDGLGDYFPGDITPTNLFATGIVEVRKDLDKVALGALLHMVQDSFSQAHTERGIEPGGNCAGTSYGRPGRINRFYSYARQHSGLHDDRDTFDALSQHTIQASPTVVDASRAFVELWERRASWSEVEPVFDCMFELQDPSAGAEPGPFAKP